MNIVKNFTIAGSADKPITLDIFYRDPIPKPTVIYAHGFNGFKDWGNFDLIARQFVNAGFTFIKFNFSHNGTTPEQPQEFADLETYGENNYSRELEDLGYVIDWTLDEENPQAEAIRRDSLFLIGHSMGGGIVLVKAAEDDRISGVATWASVGALTTPWGKWSAEKMEQWKKSGVEYVVNGRTGQKMPQKYQLYEDYLHNKDRLDVEKAVRNLKVPVLLCHGTKDEAVPVNTARELAVLNRRASVFILDSDHVFGRKHPWDAQTLPAATQQVVDRTIQFFDGLSIAGVYRKEV